MTNNNIDPAGDMILAAQDAERLEKLPSAEVARELAGLKMDGQMPAALWKTIRAFRARPAAEIACAMEDEERREIARIEAAPISEVWRELDGLGVDRQRGAASVLCMAATHRAKHSGGDFAAAAGTACMRAKPPSRRWRTYEYVGMAATVGFILTLAGLMLPPRSQEGAATKGVAADATPPTPGGTRSDSTGAQQAPGGVQSPPNEKSFYRLKNSSAGAASHADEGARLTAAPAASEFLHPDSDRLGAASGKGLGAGFSFSKAQNSLVRILVRLDKLSRAGSGFLVSGKRLVATSNHVIENGKNFDLGFLDNKGRARWIHAELKAADPAKDLAILEAGEDIEGATMILGDYEPEWAGDVYAMGFPVAADEGVIDASSFSATGSSFLRPSVVKGIVSRVLDNPSITARMQHQAPISPGYSGGPLVDRCGAVVGVSNSHHKTDTGLSYAVLGSDLVDLARRNRIPVNVSAACGPTIVEASHSEQTPSPGSVTARDTPAIPLAKQTVAADPYESEMFRQAASCIERADIAAARLFLEHLAARGSARGMLGLALTYDPNFLDRIQVVGLQPDVERARKWYLRALEGGAGEARWRLEALPPGSKSSERP